MNTQKQITTGIMMGAMLFFSGLTTAAYGSHQPGYDDTEVFTVKAKVVAVEPLTRVVQVTVPQEVCWEEPVRHSTGNYESATPKVLGGILGGVAGNQFGGGRGNKLMTVAGVLLGASIGRDVAQQRSQAQGSYVSYERVCETEHVTHEEERSDGYRVTYRYAGREFVTRTDEAPGKFIHVRVRIEAVGL